MKNSDLISLVPQIPSLFQIAAFFEDFFTDGRRARISTPAKHLPIAEFMLNPEKLMSVVKTVSILETPAAEVPVKNQRPTRKTGRNTSLKKLSSSGISKARCDSVGGQSVSFSPECQKNVEFSLNIPTAAFVKLAGDFTDWDKSAIDMVHSGERGWLATVKLAPGCYSYRFIVDGQWHDDPCSELCAPNPFGSNNAVIQVV